jgi:hypothetical protein
MLECGVSGVVIILFAMVLLVSPLTCNQALSESVKCATARCTLFFNISSLRLVTFLAFRGHHTPAPPVLLMINTALRAHTAEGPALFSCTNWAHFRVYLLLL